MSDLGLSTTQNNDERANYAVAIHEAAHTVAAYDLGLGMKKRGMVLRESGMNRLSGVAYTYNPGIRSQNPKRRKFFLKREIVIAFAGPIADQRLWEFFWDRIHHDVEDIGCALGELVPSQKQDILDESDYGSELWLLVSALAIFTKKEKALQDYEGNVPAPKMDPAIVDILWPLAQQARRIVHVHWPSLEKLACDLLKARKLTKQEIEARLPWVGRFVVT